MTGFKSTEKALPVDHNLGVFVSTWANRQNRDASAESLRAA